MPLTLFSETTEGISSVVFETETDAQELIREHTINGSRYLSCSIYKVGEREFLGTPLPFRFVRELIELSPTPKGKDAREYPNRILVPSHVKEIYDYLVTRSSDFFLSGVTVNVESGATVVRYTEFVNGIANAYLLLDADTKLRPVSGQHRIAAIGGYVREERGRKLWQPGAIDAVPELATSVLLLQVTLESDRDRQHQDFADEAKALPMSKNIAIAYDLASVSNTYTQDVVDSAELFSDRIETANQSVTSKKLYTLAGVKNFLHCAYIENLPSGRTSFETLLRKDIERAPITVTEKKERTIRALDYLASSLPGWKEALQDVDGATLRKTFTSVQSNTLPVLGAVVGRIIRENDASERTAMLNRLSAIDWRLTNGDFVDIGWVRITEVDGKPERRSVDLRRSEDALRFVWDIVSPVEG
jgi:hypothetical protein